MDNKPILYGVIGLLAGIVLTTYTATSAVNTGNTGMMQMMGMRGAPRMMNEELQAGKNMGMNSSMEDMMDSMMGKEAGDFDQAFLSAMIVHHEGAVKMAQAALQSAQHPELKKMAQDIITAQTKEIEQMKTWQQSWGK